MKRISTFLIALSLGVTTISAQAGLITDPLSFQEPILDEGLSTDPLGGCGPKHVRPPSANVPAASSWLAGIVSELPADGSLRLSDLFMNPEFFAATHAAGPEADALRGQIDWLMLTGVILGLDGDDGLDDLTGDAGDDVLNWSWGASNPAIILGGPGSDNIILGGPGSDNVKAPINGFVFGTTSYLPGKPLPPAFSDGTTQMVNRLSDVLISDLVTPPAR